MNPEDTIKAKKTQTNNYDSLVKEIASFSKDEKLKSYTNNDNNVIVDLTSYKSFIFDLYYRLIDIRSDKNIVVYNQKIGTTVPQRNWHEGILEFINHLYSINIKKEKNKMQPAQMMYAAAEINPVYGYPDFEPQYVGSRCNPLNKKKDRSKNKSYKIHKLLVSSENFRENFGNKLKLLSSFDCYEYIPELDTYLLNFCASDMQKVMRIPDNLLMVIKREIYESADFKDKFIDWLSSRLDATKKLIDDLVDDFDNNDENNDLILTYYLEIHADKQDRGINEERFEELGAYYPPSRMPIMKKGGGVSWMPNQKPLNGRPFNSVYLPQNDLESIVKDIEEFYDEDTIKFYKEHNIHRKRIYLFHGIPGTGKTSLIKSIASSYEMNLAIMKLDSRKMNDSYLRDAFNSVPQNSVVVIEEIDTLFANVGVTTDEKTGDTIQYRTNVVGNSLTLGGLLDMLDGLTELDDQIIIMTTNHKERLDRAQLRPGRIDYSLCFDHIQKDQVAKMTKAFYKNEPVDTINKFAEVFLEKNKESTPAYLQGIFVHYRKYTLQELISIIESQKVDVKIDVSKNSLIKNKNDNSNRLYN